jgi:hypothetical protein
MRKLRRLAGLPGRERSLLLRAFLTVSVVHISLQILKVANAKRLALRVARLSAERSISVDRCVWAVKAISRYSPRATCLTQALAVHALLVRSGHDSCVEIGVARTAERLEAHAWVTCEGQVVVGGPDIARFERLAAWED